MVTHQIVHACIRGPYYVICNAGGSSFMWWCSQADRNIRTVFSFFLSFFICRGDKKKTEAVLIWFSSFCIFSSCSEWFCFPVSFYSLRRRSKKIWWSKLERGSSARTKDHHHILMSHEISAQNSRVGVPHVNHVQWRIQMGAKDRCPPQFLVPYIYNIYLRLSIKKIKVLDRSNQFYSKSPSRIISILLIPVFLLSSVLTSICLVPYFPTLSEPICSDVPFLTLPVVVTFSTLRCCPTLTPSRRPISDIRRV